MHKRKSPNNYLCKENRENTKGFVRISIKVLLLQKIITVLNLCMRKRDVFDIYIVDLILYATCL